MAENSNFVSIHNHGGKKYSKKLKCLLLLNPKNIFSHINIFKIIGNWKINSKDGNFMM